MPTPPRPCRYSTTSVLAPCRAAPMPAGAPPVPPPMTTTSYWPNTGRARASCGTRGPAPAPAARRSRNSLTSPAAAGVSAGLPASLAPRAGCGGLGLGRRGLADSLRPGRSAPGAAASRPPAREDVGTAAEHVQTLDAGRLKRAQRQFATRPLPCLRDGRSARIGSGGTSNSTSEVNCCSGW